MRDYLYIWNDPAEKLLTASGIEFRDMAALFGLTGGIALLKHSAKCSSVDNHSGFEFVPTSRLSELLDENVYSWGDFDWADFSSHDFPLLEKHDIAELLYFRHTGRPYGAINIPGLGNKFLGAIHDDGWRLKLYYSDWLDLQPFLASIVLLQNCQGVVGSLHAGSHAYWISDGKVELEERTEDVDEVMNRRK